MFKLQRLEITGFKSFADYTEIVFTGNGITAVVGPNGCGKSNVSDAISWVLGEQRAKTLRGAEMKDVVFQGAKTRKPSGMAEVVLHLVRDDEFYDTEDHELEDIDETLSELDENAIDLSEIEGESDDAVAVEAIIADAEVETNGSHGEEFETEIVRVAQVGSAQTVTTRVKSKRHWRPRTFALEFAPGEAISVGRRLYLSGESEYQLNGKNCRLRDIQDLFAGTGLSGSHYAIIEQGRIGQILSAKPGDRRNLIEEAAGISKFRTRQRAAEARLESAKTNLGRISDIVSEIDKQVNSLRRQAGKTRRYKLLQEDYRVLMRQFFAAEGKFLSDLSRDLGEQLRQAADLEGDLAKAVEQKESAGRDATQKARVCEDSLAETRRRHAENALERDRAEREHRYQAEQIANLNTRIEVLRGEISSTEQRIKLIAAEIEKLKVDETREREVAGKAESILLEAELNYKAKVSVVSGIDAEAESVRTELLQHTAASERFAEIGRQLNSNLEKLSERVEGLAREAARAETAYGENRNEAESLLSALNSESAKLARLDEEKQQILAQSAAARDRLGEAETGLNTIKEEFAKKKNRLETLQELEEKRAVYAPQVQKLFAAQNDIGVRFQGVLADRLNVDQKWERAVESLFGTFLQTILVETIEDARKVSAWLQINEVGRTAILVASTKGKSAGRSGLDDILGIDGQLGAVLHEAFPREMSAQFVESLNGELPHDDRTLVDAAGNILFGSRLLMSGKPSADGKNASLLAFKRELHDLERASTGLESEIVAKEKTVESARAVLAETEVQIVDLQSLIIKVERGLHGLEFQEKSARQEIERAERHRKVVADEISHATAETTEIETRIADADSNRLAAEQVLTAAEQKLEEIARQLASARSESDAEATILNEKRMVAATSSERARSAQSALRRVETERKELEARLTALNREITDGESRISALQGSVSEIAGRIASSESDLTREQEELATETGNLAKARFDADVMNDELVELNHSSAEARNARAEIEVRQAEAVTRLKNIGERCTQELNLPLPRLIETEVPDPGFDLDAARISADDLRQKLENFGAVNMLAVDELAESEERLQFLTSQRQDIIDSIATAEEALREIKERSRERFRHAFDAINENFVGFFQELFGGGRGGMVLLESDDILEAGIEVVAQPPGKRLQNILLLSGGEKAMTAIALVLAIFKYRPSPFCLLDEVDAPLDDANVGRFVNKIAEMSEKTQFIVITHNKRTMEAARALYGVTMQEAGVSKVVSVKFE